MPREFSGGGSNDDGGPVHLRFRGPAARALTPMDLRFVGLLLARDPREWSLGEAKTLREIRRRAGEAAHRALDHLLVHANRIIGAHDESYRPLIDEYRSIQAQLGTRWNHDVFGRKLAEDRVDRAITNRERQLKDEVRERWAPVLETAISPEHGRRIEAQMYAEMQKVDGVVNQMRQNREQIQREEAGRISRERQAEKERVDRVLCLRQQQIQRLLTEAGVEIPRTGSNGSRSNGQGAA
jgi:hypothetical protein